MEDPAIFLVSPDAAIGRIREIFKDSRRVYWTKHATERMKGERITTRDVLTVVKNGGFRDPPHPSNRSELECSIEGYSAGRPIRVALGLYLDEESVVAVVTAFEIQ